MIDRSAATVAAIGEHGLIERLERRVGRHPAWVTLGIGDDAALVEPARGEIDVLTTDSLVEDVHFRRSWTSATAIGHKSLAVSLSDLAAMGATPRACLLNLALPPALQLQAFDEILDGLLGLAALTHTPLVGGNIAESPGPLVLDVTALGSARRRRVLRRSGGHPRDELYVTGSLGGARGGLLVLQQERSRADRSAAERACVERFERPSPRLRTGRAVGRQGLATSAIDLSDGLADAVRQMARASSVGAVVSAAAIPVDPAAVEVAGALGADAVQLAVDGGEDYELLFAVPPRRRRAFLAAVARAGEVSARKIGELTKGPEVLLEREGRLQPLSEGYSHFGNRS